MMYARRGAVTEFGTLFWISGIGVTSHMQMRLFLVISNLRLDQMTNFLMTLYAMDSRQCHSFLKGH